MLVKISNTDILCPLDFTFIGHKLTGYYIHECGLSFAIGTDKSYMLAL